MRGRRRSITLGWAAPLAAISTLGCNTLLGLDPGKIPPVAGGGTTTVPNGGTGGGGCAGRTGAGCTGLVWTAVFGDTDTLHAEVTSMGIDEVGDIVLAGYFGSTITIGGSTLYAQGAFDYFLVKIDVTGQPLWAKRFGSADNDSASFPIQVAVTKTGQIALAGAVDGEIDFGGGPLMPGPAQHDFDVFVVRFDDQGNHLWSGRYGTSPRPQVATQVAIDPGGDVVLAGWFQGSLDFGGGPLSSGSATTQNGYVAKLAGGSGAYVWAEAFDATQSTDVGALAADTSGNLILAGNLDGSLDFGGSSLDGYGLYLARLDGTGSYQWGRACPATGSSFGTAATFDRNGDALVAGTFGGSIQFGASPSLDDASNVGGFLVKLDPTGNARWAKALPTTVVATDGMADIVVAGGFTETVDLGGGPLASAGGKDILLGKLDPTGAPVWIQRFGDSSNQYGTAVAIMPGTNRIVVAAAGGGSVDFGDGAISGNGTTNVFLAVFEP
jgi:hypothetical protein